LIVEFEGGKMTDEVIDKPAKALIQKKLVLWISVVLVLVVGSIVGIRSLLIQNAVSNFETSFASQSFEDAREAIEALRGLDSENLLIESGLRDVAVAEQEIEYLAAFEQDDLDGAISILDGIIELEPVNRGKFDELANELSARIESKDSFEAGMSAFEAGDYSRSIPLLKRVIAADALRYEDAQIKLAQASKQFVAKVSTSVKKLVSKEFFISAYLKMEEAKQLLGNDSAEMAEINTWFSERFEKAKENALNNEMAVRKDSFTGRVSYYYKPTYVTCCGGSLQAADRFRLVISGNSNPSLLFNVMLYQDDWVFADEIKANIDGQMWTIATDSYFGDTIERDNANGSIGEYVYREATREDLQYLISARESQKTLIRFQGDQARSDFAVSSRMKDGIEQVLLAYIALGGRLDL
jgi:hypothetical protein